MFGVGSFEVHAGDFKKGKNHGYAIKQGVFSNYLLLRRSWRLWSPWRLFREKVKFKKIASVELASEESVQRLGGAAGWGIAGAALLGPVGLLAGLLSGGRSTDVTFVCQLKDGRKFMATAPKKVFLELQAVVFK